MKPDQRLLHELVRRIVDAAHPLRIILFGSTARGEMRPNSDLDTLVIMPDGSHRGETTQEIYRHLWGLGFAKDIVVVTESDIQEHAANPSLVVKEALETGKELYHAAARRWFSTRQKVATASLSASKKSSKKPLPLSGGG